MDLKEKKSETVDHDNEDEHVLDHVHRSLLENIKQIHGKPKITPATRTEYAAEVSEFNISSKKRTRSGKSTIQEADLIRSLKKKKPKIAEKLEAAKKTRTLSKPLETVHEKRAQREAGYIGVKTHLNAWNDIVLNNRVADQLTFPLKSKQIEVYDHTDSDLFSSFTNLTPLEQKFQKILNASESSKEEEKKLERSKLRLTLKDMIEKRKTFSKIKAQASYQIAKSRRQNKIKSKKYHRILRREKTKQQIKDFELLQKTDPEAALKQLEQLEKSRAEERATLRHRNTGQWARNQLIKAKYNKESREAISEQLTKSRELTEKIGIQRESSDSDSADDEELTSNNDRSTNPNHTWFGNNEYTQFVNNYKEWKESENPIVAEKTSQIINDVKESNVCSARVKPDPPSSAKKKETSRSDRKKKKFQPNLKERTNETCTEIRNSSGVWTVTWISNSDDVAEEEKNSKEFSVSEIFNSLEDKLEEKFKKKLEEVRDAEITTRRKTKKQKPIKQKPIKPDLVSVVQKQEKQVEENEPQPNDAYLENEIPDLMTTANEVLDDDDEIVERDQRMTISDALAAEDVVIEFQSEKQKVEDTDKPQVTNTSLPGWGTWTDASTVPGKESKKSRHRRTNKRLLFKIPRAPPRKDANKGLVIIKEGVSDKLKEHMVSELPYPFTKVKDFEAHIRAPIGRTWLPETAHQQLIAPAIVTKLGAVIEPMDEGELVQREHF